MPIKQHLFKLICFFLLKGHLISLMINNHLSYNYTLCNVYFKLILV